MVLAAHTRRSGRAAFSSTSARLNVLLASWTNAVVPTATSTGIGIGLSSKPENRKKDGGEEGDQPDRERVHDAKPLRWAPRFDQDYRG